MKILAVLFIAALEIGGAYGAAAAEVESLDGSSMILSLEVEVLQSATSVVAHLAFEDERPLALPLLDRGGGVFGIRTELEAKNYVVVFEAIGQELSQPVLLTDLGADLTPEGGGGVDPSDPDDGLSNETRQWGWLALGLGAASLSALAFWVLGGREGEADSADSSEEEE